ncbi:MAG: hypothetical protein R3181_08860 [Rubricoccaceae bacterium]|nr:hypothetical protein [Rubricoccaceae bacterium]
MRSLFLPLALVGLVLAGCESSLDAPTADLSLQTRDALEVLPAGADLAAMVNLRAAHESAMGRPGGPFSVEGMSGEGAARFDEFVRLTGFDPEEDLDRVYLAVADTDREAAPAFVVYGDFDRARIDAYLQDNVDADVERTTIAGLPVYLGTDDEGRRFGLALVNDEMALAGEERALRAMVQRVEGGGGLDTDAEMMRLIERAAYADGAWVAARNLDAHDDDGHHPAGDLARAHGQMSRGVVSFDFRRDGVAMQAVGVPRTGTRTEDVADLLRGGVAAMRTQAQDEPDVVRALDDVEVRASGDAVSVRAFVPQALMDRMAQEH